jgi:leader peptidase (prepilin peptidase)/N-methyltransferase
MITPDTSLRKAAPLAIAALYGVLAIPALRETGIPVSVVLISLGLAAVLIALSIVDLREMRLPDVLTLPLIVAGPLLALAMEWDGGVVWRIASAAAGFAALFAVAWGYRALRGRAGLGLGDAKLLAAAGAWLGMEALPSVMLWACGSALLAVLAAAAFRLPVDGSTRIPFGPFLALGFWIVWLYGSAM